MWHPFDDSRGLYDPNTTERGLQKPVDVVEITSELFIENEFHLLVTISPSQPIPFKGVI